MLTSTYGLSWALIDLTNWVVLSGNIYNHSVILKNHKREDFEPGLFQNEIGT